MPRVLPVILASAVMALSLDVLGQTSNSCDGAELREVTGNVLVSTKDGMIAGIEKQVVANKTRVTTTSRASVTIVFDCGCDVKLKENERIDIENPSTCAALLASVTAVPGATALGAATASAGAFTATNALIAVAVGVGGYLIYRNNRNQSPN